MSLDAQFSDAQIRVKTLKSRPSNQELLQLYALYKQGSEGNCAGKRPGIFDIKGRAKFDAWALKKGVEAQTAQTEYVSLVNRLLG